MFIFAFAFVLAFAGTSAAAVNDTVNDTTANTTVCAADPVISGNVTIQEFDNAPRNLSGAQIVVNSTSGRVLASTTTDANGHYSVSFYSTETSFIVTASYIGCNPITYTVPVTLNATDGIAYGTRNFQLTPITGNLTGTSYGQNIYIKKKGTYNNFAGIITVRIPSSGGSSYSAYCIDIYTDISVGDVLDLNGPLPGTINDLSTLIDWGKVNYILTHYDATTNSSSTRNIEAAAIQCAIWYFTSVQYGVYPGNDTSHPGYYQFMTYSPRYNSSWTGPYDGYTSATGTAVYNRAWQIIDSAISIDYPYTVNMTPETVRLPNGGSTTLTTTVLSQDGSPMNNVTVNFSTTAGSFSPSSSVTTTTATTNTSGQATVTLYGRSSTNSTATVTTWVQLQKYGTLLYDDVDEPLQNLAVIGLVPYTLRDYSYINFDTTANVTISQTVTTPVNVGSNITYVVTARNTGPYTATGIMISDIIPAGFTATPSIGTTFSNGVWIIPSLTNGSIATLTITGPATAAMAGTWTTNTATRTAQDQYNAESNTTSASAWTKLADVTLTSTVNSPVNVGEQVTYIVTATNTGPDTATNINIHDIIPAALSGVTVTPSVGTYNSTTGIWTIPSLAHLASATLNITGTATAAMAGLNTTNIANKTSQTEYDPNTPDVTTAQTYTKLSDPVITQTVNGQSTGIVTVNVGETVTFLVNAYCSGPDDATNINIRDVVPTGLTDVIVTPSLGTYNPLTGIWTINFLEKYTSAMLNITGKAGTAMAGLNITNNAYEINQTEYNPFPGNSTSIPVYTKLADVTLGSTVNTPVNVGDLVTYLVTATNTGPDTATNINIHDIIPAALSGVTVTPSVGTYNSTTGIWTIPSLAHLASATLNITGTATAAMAGLTTNNTANWINQTEYDPNNSTTTTGTYTKKADVTVTNIANQSTLNVGETATFTVTVTNTGPDAATNINITDLLSQLPVGFTAGTPSTGTYNGTDWIINSLGSGSSATLVFTGILQNASAGTTIINHATETHTEYPFTTTVTDASIYVKQANVTITQTVNGASTATVNVGDTVTYIITAVNNGLDVATNLQITDILPTGLTDITYTASAGTYSTSSGLWNIGTLNNLATATLTITAKVTSALAGLNTINYANRTSQTEYNPNSNTTNTTIYTNMANVTLNQTGSYQSNVVTFIVTATNNGPNTATNIKITDIVPNGLTGVTVTPNVGSYDSGTGVWTIPELLNGEFATLNITGIATPQTTINNTANHTNQTEYDPNIPEITKTSVYVPQVDINLRHNPWYYNSLTGTYQYEYTSGNTPVFYVIASNSNKYDDASNVIIQYTLGTGYDYRGYDTQGIGTVTYNELTRTLTWNIAYMPKGSTLLLKVFTGCIISGNMTPALTNDVRLNYVDQYDVNSTNNNATCALIIDPSADIGVNQTYTTSTESGTPYVTYTINVANNGPDNATNVRITDKLPTGLTFYKISLDGGNTWLDSDPSYNKTTGVWTIGNFNYGDPTKTLMIKAIITGTGTIKNAATKTQTEHDWNLDNNAQTTILVVSGTYNSTTDVYILRHVPWYYNSQAGTYQYEYTSGNTPVFYVVLCNSNKYDDASNVTLEYTLGTGYTYQGYDTQGIGTVTYNELTRTLTWNIAYMPKSSILLLKVFTGCIISGNMTPALTNDARITHVDQYDVNSTNNNATCALIIDPSADIGVNQTYTTSTESGTQYITYTINVANNGPNNATNVTVTDKLPSGLTFYKISLDGGNTWLDSDPNYNQTTGAWTIGNFNYGDPTKTLMIKAIITGPATLKNTVTKTQTGNDWNLGNNSKTTVYVQS